MAEDRGASEIGLGKCPLCGEDHEIYLRRKENNQPNTCTHIQCEGCGAIGPVWDAADLDGAEYDAAIIAEWNSRAA